MNLDPTTMNTLLTGVISVATATLVGLGGVGIALMNKKLGLSADQNALLVTANMRSQLQATLVTAAGKYVLGDKQGAINYVVSQAGEAAAHLNVTPDMISDLIVNKAAAMAGVTGVVVDNTAVSKLGQVAATTLLGTKNA